MISRRAFLGGAVAAVGAGPTLSEPAPTLAAVLFDPDIPVLGNPNGDVTIAEFFDYLCPYCKKIHPRLGQIVEEDGGVRLVMKDWPINGDRARYASRMVLAAACTGSYGKAHNAVMAIGGGPTLRRVDDAMRGEGIDVASVRDALDAHLASIEMLLVRNEAQARALALAGTPAFIIGKSLYRRALAADEILEAIREARRTG